MVWGKGCKGKLQGLKSAAAPKGEAGGGSGGSRAGGGGEVWTGDGSEGDEEKNKRAVERQGLLREEGRSRVGAWSGVAPGGRANHGFGERSEAGGGAPRRRCRAPRPSPIS